MTEGPFEQLDPREWSDEQFVQYLTEITMGHFLFLAGQLSVAELSDLGEALPVLWPRIEIAINEIFLASFQECDDEMVILD